MEWSWVVFQVADPINGRWYVFNKSFRSPKNMLGNEQHGSSVAVPRHGKAWQATQQIPWLLDDSADNLNRSTKNTLGFTSLLQVMYFASDKLFMEWLLLRYKYEDHPWALVRAWWIPALLSCGKIWVQLVIWGYPQMDGLYNPHGKYGWWLRGRPMT